MIIALLSVMSWIGVGYAIKSKSIWEVSTFLFLSLFLGLVNYIKLLMTGKVNDKSTN